MSAISEKVRKAIFAKSNVGALVGASGSGKLTAIYESKAPENAVLPYGVFNRQAPKPVTYAFNVTLVLEDDLWLLKVLADEDSSATKEPQEFAEDMLSLWETTIGTSLTLTGNTVVWIARNNDMPPFEEKLTDRYIYHRGFLLSVKTE